MLWKLTETVYSAETDFGTYRIKSGSGQTFDLSFTHGDEVLMTGNHPSVTRAKEVASEDNAYRHNMWETL